MTGRYRYWVSKPERYQSRRWSSCQTPALERWTGRYRYQLMACVRWTSVSDLPFAIGKFVEKNDNFCQFFLKKCQVFWQFFDIQLAIFRRVRSPVRPPCLSSVLTSSLKEMSPYTLIFGKANSLDGCPLIKNMSEWVQCTIVDIYRYLLL